MVIIFISHSFQVDLYSPALILIVLHSLSCSFGVASLLASFQTTSPQSRGTFTKSLRTAELFTFFGKFVEKIHHHCIINISYRYVIYPTRQSPLRRRWCGSFPELAAAGRKVGLRDPLDTPMLARQGSFIMP